jgi:hypothetical protein
MRRRAETPFPVIGKLGEPQLETVEALCRPGEQPRFVIAEGIYGLLVAFEDRLAIVKKGAMTSWLSGARGEGLLGTFAYAEIGGIRFVARKYYGTLEIIPPDDDDPDGELSRAHTDPQKRDDAIELSLRLYEQAFEQLEWLRERIREVRFGADPALALVEQLERLRGAEIDAGDREPFETAIDEAIAAAKGVPLRRRGVPAEVYDEIGAMLTYNYGVTVPGEALVEIYSTSYVVWLAIAYGASDTDLREEIANVLAEELVERTYWAGTTDESDELRAAAEARGWTVDPSHFI